MDFITQNLLGAVAGHAAFGRSASDEGLGRVALLAGAIGGAVPDFDFLLRRFAEPGLPFELHRHFTHSLVFIPVGGLLATLPLLLIPRCRRRFGLTLGATTVGCATHGLLDNLTSYGTHLLWPFTAHRTAWDAMSIIDPIFSGLLLLGIVAALVRGHARPARVAFMLALSYIAFGFIQHERAMGVQREIAERRGHEILHGRALPTLGNVLVFRSIYEAEGRLWADAVRVNPFGPAGVREGASIERFSEASLPPGVSDRTLAVFRGLESFADGFVARVDPVAAGGGPLILGDMRLSMRTDGFKPLWGIAMRQRDLEPIAWSGFSTSRRAEDVLGELRADLFEPEGRFRLIAGE